MAIHTHPHPSTPIHTHPYPSTPIHARPRPSTPIHARPRLPTPIHARPHPRGFSCALCPRVSWHESQLPLAGAPPPARPHRSHPEAGGLTPAGAPHARGGAVRTTGGSEAPASRSPCPQAASPPPSSSWAGPRPLSGEVGALCAPRWGGLALPRSASLPAPQASSTPTPKTPCPGSSRSSWCCGSSVGSSSPSHGTRCWGTAGR